MYIPKRYGQSKIEPCPFCGKQAIIRNRQKIPVCEAHRDSVLEDLKCACGNYLETKVGKFGLYFSCLKCGNVSPKRALELNPPKARAAAAQSAGHPYSGAGDPGLQTGSSGRGGIPARKEPGQDRSQRPREIIVSPDDPNYFD